MCLHFESAHDFMGNYHGVYYSIQYSYEMLPVYLMRVHMCQQQNIAYG